MNEWLLMGVGGALVVLGCSGEGPGDDGLGTCPAGDATCDPGAGAGGSATGSGGAGTGSTSSGGSSGAGGSGSGGTPGSGGTGGTTPEPEPVCEVEDPDEYVINQVPGGGGDSPATSGHFAIYGDGDSDDTLHFMEAAHQCFVRDWCFRSPGLSHHSDDGPHNKMNIYVKVIDAGGVMGYHGGEGLAYLDVHPNSINSSFVVVHEFGHALTLTEYGWVNQGNTGLWWESIANFIADAFHHSPYCEPARTAFDIPASGSNINLGAVIGNSHLTIVNNSNQYEAWPFFTYLTQNPDDYAGLGKMVVPELFRNHLGNNETPLHVLERVAESVSVQTILGRYWARMAYVDIEAPEAQNRFFQNRGSINFDILDSTGGNNYTVKTARRPRYAGANIIPLTVAGDGTVSVTVTNLGNGQSDSNFTATLSILEAGSARTVRYVDLPGGTGQATVADGEEVSLVVANTPDNLYLYNPSDFGSASTSHPANTGLNYSVTIHGANPEP